MAYWLAANLVLILHLAFILFVVAGGLLVLRRRWVAYIHLPAVVWAALLQFRGWICPLTPLENWLRQLGGMSGYQGGFIEHYLLPVIYPAGLDRDAQLILGGVVILINLVIYGWLLVRRVSRQC